MKQICIIEDHFPTNIIPQQLLTSFNLQLSGTKASFTDFSEIEKYSAMFLTFDANDKDSKATIISILGKKLPIPTFIFFNSINQPEASTYIESWCSTFEFEGGIIDTSLSQKFLIPVFRHISNMLDRKDLIKTSEHINQIEEKVAKELEKIKKIHTLTVPRRIQNFKGIKICSKYGAGISNGSDYFDIAHDKKELTILLSSTNSYLISNFLMSSFSELKKQKKFKRNDLELFLKNMEDGIKIIENNKGKKIIAELAIININLKNLTIEGYNFGNTISCGTSQFSLNRNNYPIRHDFLNKAKISKSLDRNDKVIILSPGISKNLAQDNKMENVLKKITGQINDNSFDILNNIFMEMLSSKVDNFYENDAFAVAIEVDKNVIIET